MAIASEKPKTTEKRKDAIDELLDQIELLTKEKEGAQKSSAECLDKFKRLQADMDNLQKITRRQVQEVTRQASEGLLRKLLPVLDALEQATKMTQSASKIQQEEIAVGLKMLQKQLTEVLNTEGLEEIPTVGLVLDPDKHEAVNYVENDEKAENTILEEVRKGYQLNGTVIRPSLVVVSRGKPPEQKREEEKDV